MIPRQMIEKTGGPQAARFLLGLAFLAGAAFGTTRDAGGDSAASASGIHGAGNCDDICA